MTSAAPLFPIVISVPGPPQGKGRPRFDSVRKRTYTPERTRCYEAVVQTFARVAMRSRPPVEQPVFVMVTALMPIPPSYSKTKREAAEARRIWPAQKLDIDNILKAALDALNGVVWRDDSQVVGETVVKVYSARPGLRIRVIEATPLLGDEGGDDIIRFVGIPAPAAPLCQIGGIDA